MRNSSRPSLLVAVLVVLMAMPAVATEPTDTESSESTLDSELNAEESESIHPTNYPHRHRRRRVRHRRRRHHRRFGDKRTSMYVGLGLLGNFFFGSDSDISKVYRGGGGFNLQLGARFNRNFALEFGYLAAFQETESVNGVSVSQGSVQAVTLDGKIFVAPGMTRIEPFVQLGVGAYLLSEAFNEELTGVGFNLGGGVDIRFSQFVALGLRLIYRGFHVDNSDNNYYAIPTQSAFLNTVTAEANLQLHF